jgi:hypothetical protein
MGIWVGPQLKTATFFSFMEKNSNQGIRAKGLIINGTDKRQEGIWMIEESYIFVSRKTKLHSRKELIMIIIKYFYKIKQLL